MKIRYLLLILILFAAFFVRLYRIDGPVADWHSWRQADTSAVSRNFVKNGFDLLHPRFDDLSNVASGKENPQGFRFVEFPIYNAAQAGLFVLFDRFSIEVWGRVVSIFSSLLSMVFLYVLVAKRLGARTALLTSAFFGLLPFNTYYGRTLLPDPSMVMAILGGTYFFDLAIEKEFQISNFKFQIRQWLYFVLAIIFTASAILLKPFALFFTLPIMYLAFQKWGIGALRNWKLWLFALLAIAPFLAWRSWMTQYPEGIPANAWLFNANDIRFKGAFFQWIFADRISKLILGYWGLPILIIGLIRNINKSEGLFFLSFLASSLLYLFVMAGGNVQHDYYQILIIPTIAIFLGKGADSLLGAAAGFNKIASRTVLITCVSLMMAFGWYHIRDYFNINNPGIVEAGKKADEVLPKNARVIVPYLGDTSFLYQTNRAGWPLINAPIEKMIENGGEYLVIANPTKDDFSGFGQMFTIIASSDRYLILDLKNK